MARCPRGRRLLSSRLRSTPHLWPACQKSIQKGGRTKNPCKAINNDWKDATCSVCMEYPHNAVLLLCSSHDKGCRPYMCGTSYRFSNCLDQFKKAYTKIENAEISPSISNSLLKNQSEIAELTCPLCRGQVKGWTVVEAAREYLNKKKRSCMQDGCSFVGNYKLLRKHVKAVHPSVKPHQVDPVLEEKWKTFQDEREREDVMSTIRSSMPGAMVLGDYVIDNDNFDGDDELFDNDGNRPERDGLGRNWLQFLWFLHTFDDSRNASFASRLRRSQAGFLSLGEDDGGRSRRLSPFASDSPLHGNAYDGGDNDLVEEIDDDVNGDEAPLSIQRRGLVGRSRRRRLRNWGCRGCRLMP